MLKICSLSSKVKNLNIFKYVYIYIYNISSLSTLKLIDNNYHNVSQYGDKKILSFTIKTI